MLPEEEVLHGDKVKHDTARTFSASPPLYASGKLDTVGPDAVP
jgi:hypothetical protein